MPETFEQLARGFLADYLEFYPTLGAGLGLHVYDGRPGDFAGPAIDAFLRTLGSWERRFAELAPPPAGTQADIDAALIRGTIAHERFRWNVLADHTWSPMSWADLLDLTGYLKRNYAPLPERLRALVAHMEQVPRVLGEMRGHLRATLAAPIVSTALDVYRGYLNFYGSELPRLAAAGLDDGLRPRFDAAREAALEAIRDVLAYLEEAARRADQSFPIGETAYREMLRTGEMVDFPLERLLEIGEAELARLAADVVETARRIDRHASAREVMGRLGQHHPTADRLIPETRAVLDDLRRFLVEHEIVTVPDVLPLVEETPEFNRWAFAMMDTAGAFEEVATESYYYVTPPEPTWSPDEREQWLTKFDYATLKAVSIHEAYPGHFVHFMHVRRAPSPVAKVLHAYSFVEGWAHYCEEMMLEAGVDPSLQFRLACLGEALVRQVRYLVAIRMHTRGMSVDEAAAAFEREAYMEPVPARQEAVRGTFDPGYLNYTLGKYMMRKLRADYRAQRGADFSLREFHDRLIGLGAPPVPLARRALLARNVDAVL